MSEAFDLDAILNKPKDAAPTEPVIDIAAAIEDAKTVEVESATTTESEEDISEEAAIAATEDDTSETTTEPEPVKESHRSTAAERRIAKLVKEREQLKGQLALYQQHPQGQQEQQAVQYVDVSAPNPVNYPEGINDLDYKLDLRDYTRTKERKDLEFREKLSTAHLKYPDLQELIDADEAKTNATMAELIKESDVPVDLFHYLMANPAISNKIAAMSPTQTAKEIGKIEAQLELKAKATTPAVTKKAATLPPPINPVKSTKSAQPKPGSQYTVY